VIFLIGSTLSNNQILGKKLVWVLNSAGICSALYGLIQIAGLDPFEWINPYSPVFGFFGNPNFFASFMGFASAGAVNNVINKHISKFSRVMWLVVLFFYLFNIYKSKSQQGFLVVLTVCTISLFLWLRTNQKYSKFVWVYLILVSLGIIGIVMDILQKAPWKSFLYKQSVTFRGDYWQAGWKMAIENPVSGIGLDGYRDGYRAALSFSRASRLGAGEPVDSAHNVFIDIASGGGFIMLITYVSILLITINRIKAIIKNQTVFDPIFATLLAAWLGFIVQSFISINHIGLAIWGWSLTGYLLSVRNGHITQQSNIIRLAGSKRNLFLAPIISLSLITVFPLVRSDTEYRAAVKSGDIIRIEKSINSFPRSVIKYNYIAQLLESNGFSDESIKIARQGVKVNPNNYEAWQTLLAMSKISEEEKIKAKVMINYLNPNLVLFK
jgi:hypothetical protein